MTTNEQCSAILALRRWCVRPAGHAGRHGWQDIPDEYIARVRREVEAKLP